MLYKYVSPVIWYRPVSPVAPPNNTTFVLCTTVIVWPNLACGKSPCASNSSTQLAAWGLFAPPAPAAPRYDDGTPELLSCISTSPAAAPILGGSFDVPTVNDICGF